MADLYTFLLKVKQNTAIARLQPVGDSVWLGCGGICVAGFCLPHGYHPNPATLKVQHTSKQEHTTNVVIK